MCSSFPRTVNCYMPFCFPPLSFTTSYAPEYRVLQAVRKIYGRGQYHSDAEFAREFDFPVQEKRQGVHLHHEENSQRSEKNLTFKADKKSRNKEKNEENKRK